MTRATPGDIAERGRAARAIAESALRRALPPGIAAVSIGAGDARIFVGAPHLGLPELRAAALRCLDEADAPARLLVIVRADELRRR